MLTPRDKFCSDGAIKDITGDKSTKEMCVG